MSAFYEMQKKYFTEAQLSKIRGAKVFIIGCGGLGSNAAHALVRCGFSKLLLADFDVVEMSNLNRQSYAPAQCGVKKTRALRDNMARINPDVEIKTIEEKITEENIKKYLDDADIVVEAVDSADVKHMIFEKCLAEEKKIVCASGLAGYGCCDDIKIRRGKNFSVIGDMEKSIIDFSPLAPRVFAVAAMQADEVLRMVLDND